MSGFGVVQCGSGVELVALGVVQGAVVAGGFSVFGGGGAEPGHALFVPPLDERVDHGQVGQDHADEGLAQGPVA